MCQRDEIDLVIAACPELLYPLMSLDNFVLTIVLVRVWLPKQDVERIYAIAAEQKNAERQLSSAMGRLKDAFSALAGKSGLKRYPSKQEGDKK